jgi:hypothetical protein
VKDTNLVPFMPLLKHKEKLLLVHVIKQTTGERYSDLHLGTLPFVNRAIVRMILSANVVNEKALRDHGLAHYERWVKRMKSIFRPENPEVRFNLYLDSKKVGKWFGKRPELGRAIIGKKVEVTAGLQWSVGKRDYIPFVTPVSPTVALRPLGRNHWQVSVAPQYREEVTNWLIDTCR